MEIQVLKKENARLRAGIDKTVDQTDRRFDEMERRFSAKTQEVIDSNDKVLAQQNPVAGGAYGGPRMTQPKKTQSIFRGLTLPPSVKAGEK